MKKTVFLIIILSLAVGLPLMVLDVLQGGTSQFKVPERFEQVIVDLGTGAKNNELILERNLAVPSTVELFLQSDAEGLKQIKLVSEGEILGQDGREVEFLLERIVGNASSSATLLLEPGSYRVYLTSDQLKGKMVLGYQETPKEEREFQRLSQIHQGRLNNPPPGYREIYSTELTGLEVADELIYTLSVTEQQDVGLSIYTSASEGTLQVDLVHNQGGWFSLVSPDRRICDQLETTLRPGEYQFRLTAHNADGELIIYLKGQEDR